VTSAVESVDNRILALLEKGHTREDFLRVVRLCREAGLVLVPTFVTFTPWISLEGYQELLWQLAELDLIEHVPPIQLAMRLLIPAGSKLLELPEVRDLVGEFDPAALVYPWKHPDPRMDRLSEEVFALVKDAEAMGESRREIFARVWERVERTGSGSLRRPPEAHRGRPRATIPYLSEPWYC
jgi:hypothetical protein